MNSAKRSDDDSQTDGSDTISVVFMNGFIVTGGKAVLFRWLNDKQTWTFFAIVSAAFLILSGFILPTEIKPPEEWQVAAFTLASVFTFFAILSCIIVAAFYLSRFAPNLILPLTLVIFTVHLLNQLLASAMNTHIWGTEESASDFLIWRLLGQYLVVVACEAIFTVYVLPKSRLYPHGRAVAAVSAPDAQTALHNPEQPQTPSTPDATPVEVPAFVRISEQRFELSKIKMICTEDNYVRVHTVSDTVLVRARMNDVAKSLPEAAGVRAHRSYWVNFRYIESHQSLKNGKLLLRLSDGETVTVPRARRKSVSKALERFPISAKDK